MVVITESVVSFMIFLLALLGRPPGEGQFTRVDVLRSGMVNESYQLAVSADDARLIEIRRFDAGMPGPVLGTLQAVSGKGDFFVWSPVENDPHLVNASALKEALRLKSTSLSLLGTPYTLSLSGEALYLSTAEILIAIY